MQFVVKLLVPLFFYPLYFLALNLVDSVFGDQQLINWLMFDSKSLLLKIFMDDWLNSAPVMYLFFFAVILPLDFMVRTQLKLSVVFVLLPSSLVVFLLSYWAGFRELALLGNVLSAIFAMGFFYSSKWFLKNTLR